MSYEHLIINLLNKVESEEALKIIYIFIKRMVD